MEIGRIGIDYKNGETLDGRLSFGSNICAFTYIRADVVIFALFLSLSLACISFSYTKPNTFLPFLSLFLILFLSLSPGSGLCYSSLAQANKISSNQMIEIENESKQEKGKNKEISVFFFHRNLSSILR